MDEKEDDYEIIESSNREPSKFNREGINGVVPSYVLGISKEIFNSTEKSESNFHELTMEELKSNNEIIKEMVKSGNYRTEDLKMFKDRNAEIRKDSITFFDRVSRHKEALISILGAGIAALATIYINSQNDKNDKDNKS